MHRDRVLPGGDAPRRTSRIGKQRIMMVDGVPVLKLNNYDLEGGERSVFDQELNRALSAVSLCTRPVAVMCKRKPYVEQYPGS